MNQEQNKYLPENHGFTLHKTFSRQGCAACGLALEKHPTVMNEHGKTEPNPHYTN